MITSYFSRIQFRFLQCEQFLVYTTYTSKMNRPIQKTSQYYTGTHRYWTRETSLMKYRTHPSGPLLAFREKTGPSGCVRYFIRDVSLVQYRAIFTGILSLEAAPLVTKYRLISPIFNGILSLEATPLVTKYRWISPGTGVISLGFLYWPVNFT